MVRIFVDTGGWVALFVKNDENHERAVSVFEEIKCSKTAIYTSDYVIDETITTIMARSNHKQSVVAGKALLTSEIINIISVYPQYFQTAWRLYQKYDDKKFSFTDVTCFLIMEDLKIQKAFAFDKEFTRAGIQLV